MSDPAYRGFIETTLDALLVFEGCRRGLLPKITRRLQEFEKRALVTSGAVFVFDEQETGIKRWTDSRSWSPSRTLSNFLVYRELDKRTGGVVITRNEEGSKKMSKGTMSAELAPGAAEEEGGSRSGPTGHAGSYVPDEKTGRRRSLSETSLMAPSGSLLNRTRERQLVGSLTSTYRFRSDGLVKKTISLAGVHMIAYYKIDDVTAGLLLNPSAHPELRYLTIASFLLAPTLYRNPPLVHVAQDGTMSYRGEPVSPGASSVGSSPVPNGHGGSNQSRIASPPDPYPTGHHRVPSAPVGQYGTSSFRGIEPLSTGPSHRSLPSVLRYHRFDPYPSRPASNPTPGSNDHNTFSNPFAYPSTSHPSTPQHGQEYRSQLGAHDDVWRTETTGMSPRFNSISMTSSSAPTTHGWGPPHRPTQATQPVPRLLNGEPQRDAQEFYQPRHATSSFVCRDGPPNVQPLPVDQYAYEELERQHPQASPSSISPISPLSDLSDSSSTNHAYQHFNPPHSVQTLPPLQSYSRSMVEPPILPHLSLNEAYDSHSVPRVQYRHLALDPQRYRTTAPFDPASSYATFPTLNALVPLHQHYSYAPAPNSLPRSTNAVDLNHPRDDRVTSEPVRTSEMSYGEYSGRRIDEVRVGNPIEDNTGAIRGNVDGTQEWRVHSWQSTTTTEEDVEGGYP